MILLSLFVHEQCSVPQSLKTIILKHYTQLNIYTNMIYIVKLKGVLNEPSSVLVLCM